MASRMHAALALLMAAGAAFAQAPGGSASRPTQVDAEATGPQDSVGTSGESPTKSMIMKDDKKNAERRRQDKPAQEKAGTGQGTARSSSREAQQGSSKQ